MKLYRWTIYLQNMQWKLWNEVMKMQYLIIAIGIAFAAIGIAANEIGKFIDDISPYDWDDFDRHDVGEDFDSTDCQWK